MRAGAGAGARTGTGAVRSHRVTEHTGESREINKQISRQGMIRERCELCYVKEKYKYIYTYIYFIVPFPNTFLDNKRKKRKTKKKKELHIQDEVL